MIANKSINTNTNKGFLPSHKKGRIVMFTIDCIVCERFGKMSKRITKPNIVKPLELLVNILKLTEYIFLFNGIKFVNGYTIIPKIKQIIAHVFNVFFKSFLLSFIIKQNVYPK